MQLGYHVEGRFFGNKHAQATAYANHCAKTFGRNVKVIHVDHTGKGRVIENVKPANVRPDPVEVDVVDPNCLEQVA
jgi:hypothetical protein